MLEPEFADLHNRLGTNLRLEEKDGKTNIGFWTDARAWISYTFEIDQPGTFKIQADIAGDKKSEITLNLGDQPRTNVELNPSGGFSEFQMIDLGNLSIEEAGTYTLEIRAVNENWSPINLRNITLQLTK